jgi:hypothetical protein
MPETMAQICEWRLRAEEIRTKADGFFSTSAKEAVHDAARMWDHMADDLEKRVSRRQAQKGGWLPS